MLFSYKAQTHLRFFNNINKIFPFRIDSTQKRNFDPKVSSFLLGLIVSYETYRIEN